MSTDALRPLDVPRLTREFRSAEPFPFIVIDELLTDAFAHEVAQAYPTFENALDKGFAFDFVNEKKKVQVTDRDKFPAAVKRLDDAISSPEFRAQLSAVTGIRDLLADEQLVGGGMHVMGSAGRLDVHVDFNLIEQRQLHRRLNILIYLNPVWKDAWGGYIELWDREVRRCHHAFLPAFNRCVIFETSAISFHGVSAVQCPPEVERKSFAAYYYTREAPAAYDGRSHSTIFRARPDELLRGLVLMPAEKLQRRLRAQVERAKRGVKRLTRAVGR
jgi:Rps23 Pro-64 3,4-dihydroxylase Tpa1-like proline 4-hydroxylase